MIVEHWYQLKQAVDKGVPCYNPIQRPPHGTEDRCGDCDGCRDHGKIEEALMAVEADIERAIEEAERAISDDPSRHAHPTEPQTIGPESS